MSTFEFLLHGLEVAAQPMNLLYALIGVTLGTAVGVLPGIGPARKKALLMHFGTGRAVRNASLEDLRKAPGVSAGVAQQVYDFYHAR